jgi:2-polyprenyl-3-methyl-5-hydroxy-6-metoxy-1,4-benzoquinol methylase
LIQEFKKHAHNRFLRSLYFTYIWFPSTLFCLKRALNNSTVVLDLGCGNNSIIHDLTGDLFSVGVDFFVPYLKESKRWLLHKDYVRADITTVQFADKSFDAVLLIEVLEHLPREEGVRLLENASKWTKNVLVVCTPNGFIAQREYDSNPLQAHKSGWTVKQLEQLGFKCYGTGGLKQLTGDSGRPKLSPLLLGLLVASVTQKLVFYTPENAFGLFAVKRMQAAAR